MPRSKTILAKQQIREALNLEPSISRGQFEVICRELKIEDADDFPEGTNHFYAQLAIDTHGSAVRDNRYVELVEIGKKIWGELESETDNA